MPEREPINIVEKGWGWEIWLDNTPRYCSKFLLVEKGKRCSLHYHIKKFEMFHLIYGEVCLELEGEEINLTPFEGIVDIDPHENHRFTGISENCIYVPALREIFEGSMILEVSTEHFEDDSIRIEKGD